MSDKLTDRLRGQYQVGPDAEYGTRSFADFIPPISIEAAERIEELESILSQAKDILTGYSNNDMMGMGADEMIDKIDKCLKE